MTRPPVACSASCADLIRASRCNGQRVVPLIGMAGTSPAMTASLRQRRLDLADDRFEGPRLVNREIGEHFAVDGDAGLVEARNEAAVIEAKGTHRGVEALNPQRTEGALLSLAVAEGILVGLLHRLL